MSWKNGENEKENAVVSGTTTTTTTKTNKQKNRLPEVNHYIKSLHFIT